MSVVPGSAANRGVGARGAVVAEHDVVQALELDEDRGDGRIRIRPVVHRRLETQPLKGEGGVRGPVRSEWIGQIDERQVPYERETSPIVAVQIEP
ncbi:MAG: hypothetical protein NZ898_06655 [Myxococcota bacterium]|nr:hypothetical protein [Myxococcota bacterium]MDW8361821.1 hypothetical protein [Myxococcales bacterium]